MDYSNLEYVDETRDAFAEGVVGRTIVAVMWRDHDGVRKDTQDLLIDALLLDDGTVISLIGSGLIDIDTAFAARFLPKSIGYREAY